MYIDKGLKTDFNIANIVNEAYVGKSPTLLELEKAIGELRKIVTPNTYNNVPEILKINRLVEKQFGMKLFGLFMDSSVFPNAYTYNIGGFYDYAINQPWNYVTGDLANGYRFTKDNKFTVVSYITYGLLSNKEITDGEITAILLHEIGHNFGDCIYDDLYYYNAALVDQYKQGLLLSIIFGVILSICTLGLAAPMTIALIKRYKDFTNGQKSQTKKVKKARKSSQRVKRFFQSFFTKRNDNATTRDQVRFRRNTGAPNYINDLYSRYTDSYKDEVRKTPSRKAEVFADKFAGVYGYGPELSTALAKMDLASNNPFWKAARQKAKGNKYYEDLNDSISEALFKFGSLDCHPELIQRVNSEITLLKKEYEKAEIDPAIKKEILSQIKEMEDLIKTLTDEQEKMYKVDKAQALYNKKINEDLPDAVDEEIEDAIDKALDKALEKNEKK